MKRFTILFFCFLGMAVFANAQTYTQHLQQQQAGKGKVTVSHSKEIDNLVNGVAQDNKPSNNTANKPAVNTKQNEKTATPVAGQTVRGDSATREKAREIAREEERKKLAAEKAAAEREAAEKASAEKIAAEKRAEEKTQEESEEEMHIPTVDMRKKVMRGSKKVTGYRVQAFAGGNSRADRQKAQTIGNAIKMRYPDQPVYVHFYSPRWLCRVGNYRTYAEASTMLKAIKAMGYKSATIVKGKITVFE